MPRAGKHQLGGYPMGSKFDLFRFYIFPTIFVYFKITHKVRPFRIPKIFFFRLRRDHPFGNPIPRTAYTRVPWNPMFTRTRTRTNFTKTVPYTYCLRTKYLKTFRTRTSSEPIIF